MKIKTALLCSFIAFSAQAQPQYTELQWSICEDSAAAFLTKMQVQVDAQDFYHISYFDSHDLQLLGERIFLRQESKAGEKNKLRSKLKIEFSKASEIDEEWMSKNDAKCEYDRYGVWQKARCSLQNKFKAGDDFFSKDQLDMLDKYRPGFVLPRLEEWGPYAGQSLSFVSHGKKVNYTLDDTDANGVHLLELSLRVATADAQTAYQALTAELTQRQIQLCQQQTGKFERLIELSKGSGPKAP